jgi:Uma2 family endonuclease
VITVSVMPWPDHLLTLEEWDELPEDAFRWAELVDGVVRMTPAPTPRHQNAVFELEVQLKAPFRSRGLAVVHEVDVALAERFPPLVRQPDLVATSLDVLRAGPKRFTAGDVIVAIEVVSPGSTHIDRMHKFAEYAEAGIPHYWIVDIEEPVTLEAFTLVDGSYEKIADVSAPQIVELAEPVPITIDLAALLP